MEDKSITSPIIIEESGMKFGPFDSEHLFHIEKCDLYQKIMNPKGVAVTEFVLLRRGRLWFVEAKSATPNYSACNTSEEKRKKYDEYITSIAAKFRDSMDIYASILMKRNACDQLPDEMADETAPTLPMILVLVVKNAYPDSLRHFTEKFQQVLGPMMRIWNVQDMIVISEATAKRKGLVVSDS